MKNVKKKEGSFLGERIKEDKVKFSKNNLILSPVGSGKTYFMLKDIVSMYSGLLLIIVSTTSLKDSYESEDGVITTKEMNKRKKSMKLENINAHIMTYSEFGKRVSFDGENRKEFISSYVAILCDEVHSLFDYYMKHNSPALAFGIDYIYYTDKENIDTFQFTATTDRIEEFIKKSNQRDLLKDVKVTNYLNDLNIIRYEDGITRKFRGTEEILNVIDEMDALTKDKYKTLIFNEKINGMKKIEELLKTKGLTSISIWSINNVNNKMNDEQLKVREALLETGELIGDYDVLIINGSMREGWNLFDSKIELIILNTMDKTSQIQARGRARKDVRMVAIRVEGAETPTEKLMRTEKMKGIIKSIINKELTLEERAVIVKKLDIRNEHNRPFKWNTISKSLSEIGYNVRTVTRRKGSNRQRLTIIENKESEENGF